MRENEPMCFNGGPTVVQHYNNVGSMSLVCCELKTLQTRDVELTLVSQTVE